VNRGQAGRQVVSHPVCEILPIGAVAEIAKRQHDNRQVRRTGRVGPALIRD
jgi:hypothetical protein